MKKQLLILVLLSSVAGSVLAQAKAFEGFTAGVNFSGVGGNSQVTESFPGGFRTTNYGQQSFVPGVELGYNFAATEKLVLGLTATYDLADSKLGSEELYGYSNQIKGQNRYSINFKPGYLVASSTMVYATIGYNSMSGINSISGVDPQTISIKTAYTGIGYGLGLAVMATENIFVKAEMQQVNFGSQSIGSGDSFSSTKPSLLIGTIGLGYKF